MWKCTLRLFRASSPSPLRGQPSAVQNRSGRFCLATVRLALAALATFLKQLLMDTFDNSYSLQGLSDFIQARIEAGKPWAALLNAKLKVLSVKSANTGYVRKPVERGLRRSRRRLRRISRQGMVRREARRRCVPAWRFQSLPASVRCARQRIPTPQISHPRYLYLQK